MTVVGSGSAYPVTPDTMARGNQGSAVAYQATEYARQFSRDTGALSIFSHGSLTAKKANPLEMNPPYVMDSAQFVYWCFDHAGIQLNGGAEGVNVKRIRKDSRLKVIYTEGQKHIAMLNQLKVGDLLFFGTDTSHVGLFLGACDFISMNGSGDWDPQRGIQVSDLTTTEWWDSFNGAVLRWE